MTNVKPPPFNYAPFSGHFQAYIARLQAARAEREAEKGTAMAETKSEAESVDKRELVLKLREVTSAGLLACKVALAEAEGDFDRAVEILRVKGLAIVIRERK